MKKLITICLLWLVSAQAFALPKVEFTVLDLAVHKRIVVFIKDTQSLTGVAAQINQESSGQLLAAIANSDASTKFGDTQIFYGIAPFSQISVIGQGEEPLTQANLQALGGYAIASIPANLQEQAAIVTDALNTKVETPEAWLALGAALRDYHFDKYKTPSARTLPSDLLIQSSNINAAKAKYDKDLKHMAEGIYLARDLASEPGKTMYPESFVSHVKKAFKGVKNIDIDVLKVRDMKKRNMGALLGVGQGSVHDPRLLVINYQGADKQAPIALVGKGITFDTGGISLKQNKGMWAMKSDMAGAAAVAGTLLAVAKRGEQVNLVGVMPLAENMPSGDAIRPGDVITTMQGTTIEIISTDAEGRLILADAVRYAQNDFKPSLLLNIATLTGSAVRALSDEYAAVVTRDWELTEQMMTIGKSSGENVWPLPLHPNHFDQIKSDIADIKNSGAGNPGASIGAAVVATFIDKDLPWVHLDIAGVDWLDADIAIAPKGSQGWGVRFMDQLVRESSKADK
ncbi:leucyl aminopeptidase family protein [Thalassotalea euphylliae]|uniref:Probable cytosol aminopeptidase n=1 Tax=Thalassotalea euphylliae TaxID=1655234 RepID=A0A3E0UEI7_9GAMM|nr:leucyl aminopeptidase family protein [Thalassotalea euphylliae]REL34993.1 leucyl aminopeptidase family protein [Thalassotalea euphylliae]